MASAFSEDCKATARDRLTCPVCLTSLTNHSRKRASELGKPESCDHIFCFSCIYEWSKNVNTCPVDRIKFNQIEVYTSPSSVAVRKVKVVDVTLGAATNEDVTYCEVCHQCTREDLLLLCDGCEKGYHLDCLTPPLTEVPEGDWYCTSCNLIVQAQYDISMSSPDEEDVDYGSLHSGRLISIDIDSSSSSDENVDITGSDSDSDSSNIVVDSEPESNLEDAAIENNTESSSVVPADSSFNTNPSPVRWLSPNPMNTSCEDSFSCMDNYLSKEDKSGSTTITNVKTVNEHKTTQSQAKNISRPQSNNANNSSSEEEIVHKPKNHSNRDVIEISSSEEDDCVFIRRISSENGRRKKRLSISSDSDSNGRVDQSNNEESTVVDVVSNFEAEGDFSLPENVGTRSQLSDDGIFELNGRTTGAATASTNGLATCSNQSTTVSHTTLDDRSSSMRNGDQAAPSVGYTSNDCYTSDHVRNLNGNCSQPRATKRKRKKRCKRSKGFEPRRRKKPKKRMRRRAKGRGRGQRQLRGSAEFHGDQNSWHEDDGSGLGARLRARTAATHTPRQYAMRRAVQESYRHQDQTEGLEWARAILANAFNSPSKKSKFLESFPAPNSGYVDRKKVLLQNDAAKDENFNDSVGEDGGLPHHDTSTPVYRTYGFTPNRFESFRPSNYSSAKPTSLFPQSNDSRPESPRKFDNSHCSGLTEQQKSEVRRRMTSRGRSLSHVLVTPLRLQGNGEGGEDTSLWSGGHSSQDLPSPDLVRTLCRSLDDLDKKDCVIGRNGAVVPTRNDDSGISSQKKPNSFKSVSSSVYTEVLETRSDTCYPLPSHHPKISHRSSTDELTRKVFPVLKGDLSTTHHRMDNPHRMMEKRYRSRSINTVGGGAGDGGNNCEFDLDSGGTGACGARSGVGEGGSGSRGGGGAIRDCCVPFKHDPLLGYKIPKLNTSDVIMQERTMNSLKQDPITSGPKTVSSNSGASAFKCSPAFECDTLPNDPLTLSLSDHRPRMETKLQDMPNNGTISESSLSLNQNSLSPSTSSNMQVKGPTTVAKSSEESTSDPKRLVTKALDVHFDEGRITNRQYKRILERATRKVEEGLVRSSYMNENRVKKFVADFVKAYKYHGTWT